MPIKTDQIMCKTLLQRQAGQGRREGGKGGKTMEKEMALLQALGEEGLKEIGGQIAEIVRQHGLQKSPDLCRMLFSYMSDVIDGWNRV